MIDLVIINFLKTLNRNSENDSSSFFQVKCSVSFLENSLLLKRMFFICKLVAKSSSEEYWWQHLFLTAVYSGHVSFSAE